MANINFHNVSKEEVSLKMAYEDLISFGRLFLPDDNSNLNDLFSFVI